MLSRCHLISERYGRTDGQTDRRSDLLYQYRASVYWRAIKMFVDHVVMAKSLWEFAQFIGWSRSRTCRSTTASSGHQSSVMGPESARRLLESAPTIAIYYNNWAWKLILILPSQKIDKILYVALKANPNQGSITEFNIVFVTLCMHKRDLCYRTVSVRHVRILCRHI